MKRSCSICLLRECLLHDLRGCGLTRAIHVAVDVGGGAHIAVTEPDLDLLHLHAPCKQERGAGMSQVVEADLPHPEFVKEHTEVT